MAIVQITRSSDEILRDIRENLSQNTGINSDNPTSTAINLAKSNAYELSSMWDTMNTVLRQGFLTTANGQFLDEFGYLLQEPRSGSKRAMDLGTNNVKFYIDTSFAENITDLINRYFTNIDRQNLFNDGIIDDPSNPTSITLPENLIVSSESGGILYTCSNPITLTNTQLFDYTPVIANGVGESYNVAVGALTSHNIAAASPIMGKIINAIKVKNLFGIRNGADIETDDNYRFRLSNKVVAAVSSNETAIMKAVLSVPGVSDASLVPRTHGNGTFTIFPRSIEPIISDGLLNACIAAVQSTIAVGSVAYVEAPEYLALSMKIELRFAAGADIDAIYSNARLVVMSYINNIELGGEVIINEMVQRIMSIDDKIMDMNIPEFGFGYYDRTNGSVSSYTPLRLMNQVADYNQKWYTNANLCSICQINEI